MKPVDAVILGQGLAGSVLGWQLSWRGLDTVFIDAGHATSASKIAAGLVTPITGQRLVPSWRYNEFWPVAVGFYRMVETETNSRIFHERQMLRLFRSDEERDRLLRSSTDVTQNPIIDGNVLHNLHGGFAMSGGQLDVPRFLEITKRVWQDSDSYQEVSLDLNADVELTSHQIAFPRLSLQTKIFAICQGDAARHNPWFPNVKFDSAKGEILTVQIPRLAEDRVLHRGIWCAPMERELFRCGATYDRENLDHIPTTEGREQITSQLAELIKLPFSVKSHSAAVRPIVIGRHPVIGQHPSYSGLAYFNGLGSKGTLQAPFVGQQLVNALLDDQPIERDFDVNQRFGLR